MTESWRCFVAVPVGDEFRAAFASSVGEWRRRPDLEGLRWSEPDAWHLTLAFLGDIPAADVPRLTGALEACCRRHDVGELHPSGLGGFRSASRARVAWCGVADPFGRLRALAHAVREALGLEVEPFRAHVTLARARSAPVDLRHWVASTHTPELRIPLDRVELMRSQLGRGPARYEVLGSISLGVPIGV